MLRRAAILGLLAAFAVPAARAQALPAGQPGVVIPDLPMLDDAGHANSLRGFLQSAGSGAVLLLPVYTRCTLSCPLLTAKLKTESARLPSGMTYRVALVSFDPGDDAAALAAFRRRQALPANWLLLCAGPEPIRAFCDFFGYRVLTSGTVLQHPEEIFLLDHGLRWRATLVGEDWDAGTLAGWMDAAEGGNALIRTRMNPNRLAWIGLAGVLFGFALIGFKLLRKPTSTKTAPSVT